MIKKEKLKCLSFFPAIVLMIVIFMFSAKEDKASAATSGRVTKVVVKVAEKVMDEQIKEETPLYEKIHFYVRKSAHFLEYMALGFSFVLPYYVYAKRKIALFLFSEFSAVLYACSDEFHQLFVKGREGRLFDIGVDSCGACVGVLLGMFCVYLVCLLQKRGRNRKVQKNES